MYQDLTSVYGEQCSTPPVTQQSSFENEDNYQAQVLRPYSYAPSDLRIHPQIYSSPSIGFDNQDVRHIVPSQQVTAMPSIQENSQLASHDLNTISSRRDLQWLTTTSTDMRTQSPFSTSSPHPSIPTYYPSQPTPPNITLNPQSSFDEPPSVGASMSHSQFVPAAYSTANLPPSTSRSQKAKKASSSNPTKPKGTPGRKRKFQDHELTPEEATKRRIRRERNKVAAAKCRNRRRELTDRLQGETDQLEDHRNFLQQEVMSLQQEKEHLEFILAAHSPNCKARIITDDSTSLQTNDARPVDERISDLSFSSSLPVMDDVMGGTVSDSNYFYLPPGQPSYQSSSISTSCTEVAPKNSKLETYVKVESSAELENPTLFETDNLPTDLSSRQTTLPTSSSEKSTRPSTIEIGNVIENQEALNTPVCTLATPSFSSAGVFSFSLTPNASSTFTEPVFSYQGPSTAKDSQPLRGPTFTAPMTSHSAASYSRNLPVPFEPCALAHRRRSSSDSHNSVDSANSHHFVTL